MKQKRSWTLRPIAWLVIWLISGAAATILVAMMMLLGFSIPVAKAQMATGYGGLLITVVFALVTPVSLYTAIVLPSLAVQASDFIYPSSYSIRYIIIALSHISAIIQLYLQRDTIIGLNQSVLAASALTIAVYGITMTVYGWTAAAQRRKG